MIILEKGYKMKHILLSGGSGTRLWPLSRLKMPKQFLKLIDDTSLYQHTLRRNRSLCDEVMIVTNTEHYFTAKDQLDETGMQGRFLLEPVGRNTAGAIALAAWACKEDDVMLVTPADHMIEDEEAYKKAVQRAETLAKEGALVTFGITPEYAESGYGYIEANGEDVVTFHEKPDKATAQAYVESGRFYWNSGMFCFKAGIYLDALKRYAPDIYDAARHTFQAAIEENARTVRFPSAQMEKIPSVSIDVAVMEKAERVKVVPASIGWSDVGSFDALARYFPEDEAGNVTIAERHVELVGMRDTVVVDSDDALLVVKKGDAQAVSEVVKRLKQTNPLLVEEHTTGYRPWGTYKVLQEGEGYKIKYIEVKPGHRLSLQKHYHRNEHWIVLGGSATVTVGEKTFVVNPNESTYIKAGEVHRLANEGKLPLRLIEVQVGEYTGEDDIVRLEDDYKRLG